MTATCAVAPPITDVSAGPLRPSPDDYVKVLMTYTVVNPTEGVTIVSTGLEATLYWSRTGLGYIGIPMTAVGSVQYEAIVPRQNGDDDRQYSDGAGQLFLYIELENSISEKSYWYSANNPYSEIIYLEAGQTEIPTPTVVNLLPDEGPQELIILGLTPEQYLSNEFMFFVTIIFWLFMYALFPGILPGISGAILYVLSFFRTTKGGI